MPETERVKLAQTSGQEFITGVLSELVFKVVVSTTETLGLFWSRTDFKNIEQIKYFLQT